MGEKLNRLLDWVILIGVIAALLIFSSCSTEEINEVSIVPTLELYGRLPMDSNGYYHLTLNPYSNQTTHKIAGRVLNTLEPTKVSWKSNIIWKINGTIFHGDEVPTTNLASYPNKYDSIFNMIAPIYSMKFDTLRVECKVNEWDITQTLNIVLD